MAPPSGELAACSAANLLVERVEVLGLGAVHVEPPVADEVLLVEESPVGAEETVLGKVPLAEVDADVEGLTVGLRVSVVSLDLVVADEAGVGGEGEDGVVLAGSAGDVLLKPGHGVLLLLT